MEVGGCSHAKELRRAVAGKNGLTISTATFHLAASRLGYTSSTVNGNSHEEIARQYCVNGAEFRLPASRPSWFTAQLDETIRGFARDGRYLQMPSFHGAQAIGILSDYGGSHDEARFDTYTFLFADFGALHTFDESVKAIRDRTRLPRTREISFKALREGHVTAVIPDVLRAADMIPGLLFTLAVEKCVGSIVSCEPDAPAQIQAQLKSLGFQSWSNRQDAERLVRVLHSVAYWLSLLGKAGMKTLWMSDNDAIHGRSDSPEDFPNAYARVLPLFDAPEFSILGTAKSFEVNIEQPFLHEAVSITDLVAGAVSAYLTEMRGVAQSERRHPVIADILTLLGHQSPFLKKFTFVVQQEPDGTVATGVATINSTTRSMDGYVAVEFE